ncbi:LiaI-LiaF-like domain-containing protein [Pseudogracilibacillus sp. SO30301A]|uniref:LiaI-LiaF-like domain-containing protein n=1 Tax=Pseudogracilibacillus sp. SO30301A TaxID=3098291 RepID=UPI00300DF54F
MKKQHALSAYVLIGIGIYFLVKQLDLALFDNFYSWPTFLIIIGIAFLIHSYSAKEYNNIFTGVLLLGLGIHFHGLENYDFWFDHWSAYALIVGVSFFIRYLKTGSGLIPAAILVGIALLIIFSVTLPEWFHWIYGVVEFLETFWPVALIVIGVYLLRVRK